jgi:hypothetical protein
LLSVVVRTEQLVTTSEQRDQLEPIVDQWMSSNVALEQFALDAHSVLDRHQIDHRFLKGLALAHTAYERPDHRVFGDIDLAVPSDQIDETIVVFSDVHGPRVEPELNRGFDREFGKGATFRSADGNELDVHRTLVWGALGLTVTTDDLFTAATRFEVGGVTLEGLGAEATFLHSCYSAVLGDVPPRLTAMRDVVQTLPSESAVERVLDTARRWQATLVVATALRRAQAELRVELDHPLAAWADRYEPSRRERALLHSHLMPGGTYARRVSAATVIPGRAAKVRYLRATVWPSKEYLSSRDFTWSRHVKRSLRFADPRRWLSEATTPR